MNNSDFLGFPGLTMHFLICPPHQLKNMINALNSSQQGKPKNFFFDGDISFKYVIDAFYRELHRLAANEIGQIPGLHHDVIFKNSWNVMSVANNKALINGYLTAEMAAYAIESKDWAAARTIEYLHMLENIYFSRPFSEQTTQNFFDERYWVRSDLRLLKIHLPLERKHREYCCREKPRDEVLGS
eukprot:Pompholyxophrys_punicea_v1_NODE_682_length_1468_cov_2.704176.p2 type:complete len:185 gc:universal NODE_682_length_1468_cov_2.704176:785-1339(+)